MAILAVSGSGLSPVLGAVSSEDPLPLASSSRRIREASDKANAAKNRQPTGVVFIAAADVTVTATYTITSLTILQSSDSWGRAQFIHSFVTWSIRRQSLLVFRTHLHLHFLLLVCVCPVCYYVLLLFPRSQYSVGIQNTSRVRFCCEQYLAKEENVV